MKPFTQNLFLTACFLLCLHCCIAQQSVRGTVLDSSRLYGVKNVAVLSTSGASSVTDSLGNYSILANEKDSIWFFYNNKPTMRFPVQKMPDLNHFDISLNVKVQALYKRMKEVTVFSKSYRQDSLENREKYADVFGYEKPGLKTTMSNGTAGADLDALINVFRFRKNKYMKIFQKRLIAEEQDKYVDHKFTKKVVQQITGLTGSDRDSFMLVFRPTYEFAMLTPLYDFYLYIQMSGRLYQQGSRENLFFKRTEEMPGRSDD